MRKLTVMAFVGLAVALLPLWPAASQQPAPEPRPAQFDVKRAEEELIKLKRDYDQRAAQLKAVIEQARQPQSGPPNIEKRLADMEKKLDAVLRELRDMRKGQAGAPLANAEPD